MSFICRYFCDLIQWMRTIKIYYYYYYIKMYIMLDQVSNVFELFQTNFIWLINGAQVLCPFHNFCVTSLSKSFYEFVLHLTVKNDKRCLLAINVYFAIFLCCMCGKGYFVQLISYSAAYKGRECVNLFLVEEHRSMTCSILSMVSYTMTSGFWNIRSMYTIDGIVIYE